MRLFLLTLFVCSLLMCVSMHKSRKYVLDLFVWFVCVFRVLLTEFNALNVVGIIVNKVHDPCSWCAVIHAAFFTVGD